MESFLSKCHRSSPSQSSDGLFDGYFAEFTEEDFREIDEAVAKVWTTEDCGQVIDDSMDESFQSDIGGLNLNLLTQEEWEKLDDLTKSEDERQPTSFASEIGGLNLATLTAEDFERLDSAIASSLAGGPSLHIALESGSQDSPPRLSKRKMKLKFPLAQFRRQRILSVTDLSSPTWCEVQFDYGLRGRRSRPIKERPASFKSASGKVISVEQKVAQKNNVRTKQGLAIHKELQREIRSKELEVVTTTRETQWALRIVNMMACFKELLHGPRHMTREMPVFGILHDEVVVGVIDEVYFEVDPGVDKKRKRRLKDPPSTGRYKRRSVSKSQDLTSAILVESSDSSANFEAPSAPRLLYLRDAKTRKNNWLPDNEDGLAGRLQLYMYYSLLHQLITTDPPFDFNLLWRKLRVNPDAKLPTKFLVQVQLIGGNTDFETVSLNDLVDSFLKLTKDERMLLSPSLELVYYQRPNTDAKGKGKDVVDEVIAGHEDVDLLKAIAASLEDLPKDNISIHEAGPSRAVDVPVPKNDASSTKGPTSAQNESLFATDGGYAGPEGIRRFPLIGVKSFAFHAQEMHTHISRILEWWRGDRPPEGVPIHLASRCRTCEYANDCEWRTAKALELRSKRKL